ncbi:MAG: hypothetical protein QW575_06825 [Thermoproteota archaeon]
MGKNEEVPESLSQSILKKIDEIKKKKIIRKEEIELFENEIRKKIEEMRKNAESDVYILFNLYDLGRSVEVFISRHPELSDLRDPLSNFLTVLKNLNIY